MSCGNRGHAMTIEVIEPAPPEVAAGTTIALKAKVFCPDGCDLTGMPIKVVAVDGALVRTEYELGRDGVAEITFEAPATADEHVWSMTFGPHEVAGIPHDAVTISVPNRIVPRVTSLAVWSIPSPVVMGENFVIEIGAKSSAGISLAAELVEVRDETGAVVAEASLGETPFSGTKSLYWTRVELTAAAREGLRTWSVEFEPRKPDLPHEGTSTTFSVLVVKPPEHRLTIKVMEKQTSVPIADVQVRVGAYGATTDGLGLAQVDIPGGVYELGIWKVGYEAPARTLRIDNNMLVEVQAVPVAEEDPDAAWLM
jgi:hypothetical protein